MAALPGVLGEGFQAFLGSYFLFWCFLEGFRGKIIAFPERLADPNPMSTEFRQTYQGVKLTDFSAEN